MLTGEIFKKNSKSMNFRKLKKVLRLAPLTSKFTSASLGKKHNQVIEGAHQRG